MSSELPREDIDAMIDLLRNFPADGQLHRDDAHRDVGMNLVLYGFIGREDVQKRCPTCGTERFDYGYFKITPAGRAILALADRVSA